MPKPLRGLLNEFEISFSQPLGFCNRMGIAIKRGYSWGDNVIIKNTHLCVHPAWLFIILPDRKPGWMYYYYFIVITPIFQLTKPRLRAVGCGGRLLPEELDHTPCTGCMGPTLARPGPNAWACAWDLIWK